MPTETPSAIALRREPGAFTRSLVALLLRVSLGLTFLMVGLDKFAAIKAGKYPGMIVDQFANSPLRPDLVKLFASVLPYAEVGVGALLVVGLATTLSAFAAGALLIHLLFGQLILHQIPQIPVIFTYILLNAGILWLSPVTSNYLSLDGLLVGWFWRPNSEGDFHREDDRKSPSSGRRI
jgi:thiosulfate dehydrogenase (quinone) large subunit